MYYQDPDGNQLETQVDNFENPDDATASTYSPRCNSLMFETWTDYKQFLVMEGPLFAENALGTDFDPEELCVSVEHGEEETKLKMRKEIGRRGPEEAPVVLAKIQNATVGA